MTSEKPGKQQNIQIGSLIKEKFLESGLSIAQFANAISCKRDNVYDIFRRERIDTEQLLKISRALNFDFFKVFSDRIENKNMVQICINISIPIEAIDDKSKICEYCEVNKIIALKEGMDKNDIQNV
jgi:hypothetical protein